MTQEAIHYTTTLAVKIGNTTEDLKMVIILLLSSIFIAALQNQELDFRWPVIKNPILHTAQQPWGYWKPLNTGNLHISRFNNKKRTPTMALLTNTVYFMHFGKTFKILQWGLQGELWNVVEARRRLRAKDKWLKIKPLEYPGWTKSAAEAKHIRINISLNSSRLNGF